MKQWMRRNQWRKAGRKLMLSLLLVALLVTGSLQGVGASGLDTGLQDNEQALIDEILSEGVAEEVPELPDGVPVLDALPELSREDYVELSGYAQAGSDVMVYYVKEGEEELHIGEPVRAEESESGIGRFSL
ncbi:hypothetical protein, partial [Mycobacterium tuberculosis]